MLIGFAGRKRSGKDTAAAILREIGFVRTSFAEPIRTYVAGLLGWTMEELDARKEEPIDWLEGRTARQMMQTLGTEWGRQMVSNDLWIMAWWRRYRSYHDAGIPVSITDVRFPNEAALIHSLGGFVIEIERPGLPAMDSHASEEPLPREMIDGVLVNDCDLIAFRSRVFDLFEKLSEREDATCAK